MKCVEVRIQDPSFLRLIGRFLKAGVMEEGKWTETEVGTPQGGNLSPVLSNIFLHYVLDLWFQKKVRPTLDGYADYCRYADDFVACFEWKEEAQAFGGLLRERLAKFGLKISDKKSRIIAFGRHAWQRARRKGCRMATFDFLGFTHYGDATRKGTFKLGRKTSSKRMRLKLKAMNLWMKSVRNAAKLKEWWPVLQAKLRGHYNYFGVSGNARELRTFWHQTWQMAFKWINRRSQKKSFNMQEYYRFLRWNPLPQPKIYHSFYALTSR